MPQKPHVVDYEPVLRSGTARRAQLEFDPPEDSGASFPPPRQPAITAKATGETDSKAEVTSTAVKKLAIKRGHVLTYIGLFLFTALVYFRPYEVFPSLKWASSSAFWVGLATMLVYVPMQLQLEGKITIHLRQISLAALLLLMALLSVPLATDRSMAWGGVIEYGKVIVMFVILVNVLRTEIRLRLLINLILVVSCWMSVAAFNDYRLGRFNLPGARIEGVIGGLFDNPNDMALHLVTMIPIAAALF